jgi:hypothetical protein
MAVAEKVIVQLEAQIRDYQTKLREAEKTFVQTAGQIEGTAARLSSRIRIHTGIMGTALRATFVGALVSVPIAFAAAIDKGLEYASSLQEQAQQLGVTAKALQEYRFAGAQVGITNEQMDKGLAFLTRSFGQAQDGAKKPIKALQELGFTTKDIARIIHTSAGDAIPELADAFAKIENPAKRAAIEIGLFGRAGQAMDNLLTEGSAGVNALRDAVERMGGVLTDEQIRRADEAHDKYEALKTVLSARIAGVVADNANAILGLVNALAKLVGWLGTAGRSYQAFVAAMGVGFSKLQSLDPTATAQQRAQGRLGVAQYQSQLRDLANQQAGRGSFADRASSFRQRLGGGPAKYSPTAGDLDVVNKALRAKDLQDGGSKKDDAAERIKKARETLARYLDEANSLQQKINTYSAEEVGTSTAKLEATKANIDLQTEQEIRHIQNDEDYSAAQKATLIAQTKIAAGKEKDVAEMAFSDKLAADITETSIAQFKNQEDMLRAEEQLTDDRNKRADIEKRLIDLALSEEQAQLKLIIATSKDAEEVSRASDRLAMLNKLGALQRAGVDRQNRSPGEQYLDELNKGLANVSDTIQTMEVQQLKNLEDFLAGSVVNALHLHGALGQVADAIIRIGLQRAIIEPIANLLFGGGGSSGGGIFSIFGRLLGGGGGSLGGMMNFSGVGSGLNFGSFGRASGGPVSAGQPYIVGEKRPELFVPSTSGTIVPNVGGAAMVEVHVTAGEYFDARVINTTGPVIARASINAAMGGSQLAQRDLTNSAIHRLD